ncbi:MAG: radical SAM protein [Bacillota bacterium]
MASLPVSAGADGVGAGAPLSVPSGSPRARRRLRILLVKPDISSVSVGFTSLARVAPLDLLMVAASAPRDDCRILDLRLEEDAVLERTLAAFRPDVVGLTAYTAEAWAAKGLARRIRASCPEALIVWGGYHATMAPEDALSEPAVDVLVLGEGEKTFPELMDAFARGDSWQSIPGLAFRRDGRVVRTAPRPPIEDLDTLPMPDWSLVERHQDRYYLNVMGVAGSVETSRGCPYDCSFCSVWVFNSRRYRTKSPDRVMAELERLPEAVQVVAFVDDEFWVDGRRAQEIAARIRERIASDPSWKGRKWKYWAQVRTDDVARRPALVEHWSKAGLKVLLLGIESHKESEIRELHHKRNRLEHALCALDEMRRCGVEAWGCFIVNPDWEESDFFELAAFVRRLGIAFPQYTVLTPLPGTVLARQWLRQGLLKVEEWHDELLDFLHTTVRPRLPLRRFYELMAMLYSTTSMGSNLQLYKRAIRNGVISREWLHSETGRRVKAFLAQLTDVEAYLKVHRALGQIG